MSRQMIGQIAKRLGKRFLTVRFKRISVVFFVALLTNTCHTEPGGFEKESGTIDSFGGAKSIYEPNVDVILSPGEGSVGDSCEKNDECVTGFCMTTDEIKSFIKGAEVDNGYCSQLFCDLEASEGDCSIANGGICFSLFVFLPDFGDSGICLRPCQNDQDCRIEDDNECFDVNALVGQGLVSQETVDSKYREYTKACLPKSIKDIAIEKLQNQ